jgi:chemotaxis response regulator CheB
MSTALMFGPSETRRQAVALTNSGAAAKPRFRSHLLSPKPEYLIVFGASAGGPAALAEVLGGLPADFPAAIVIVQHIDRQFAQPLATWLDRQSQLKVRLAETDDYVQNGVALMAGRNAHLVFTNSGRLAYIREPLDSLYSPSIDVLLRSAVRFWHGEIIGVLLTGIGRDGAEGLRLFRATGHHTIAQDALSSAAYGMPKAAAELRAATEILPLNQIAPRLVDLVVRRTKLHV